MTNGKSGRTVPVRVQRPLKAPESALPANVGEPDRGHFQAGPSGPGNAVSRKFLDGPLKPIRAPFDRPLSIHPAGAARNQHVQRAAPSRAARNSHSAPLSRDRHPAGASGRPPWQSALDRSLKAAPDHPNKPSRSGLTELANRMSSRISVVADGAYSIPTTST